MGRVDEEEEKEREEEKKERKGGYREEKKERGNRKPLRSEDKCEEEEGLDTTRLVPKYNTQLHTHMKCDSIKGVREKRRRKRKQRHKN